MTESRYIVIGKIGSPYGVRGWTKIQVFTEVMSDILEYTPWYIKNRHGWRAIEVEEGKLHGKGLVAKLAGYNTPESVRQLTGSEIAILRSQLPSLPKDEYYWSDLQGLTVIDQTGKVLGKVLYLMATGSNDVLIVKGTKEFAIPYLLGESITSVDLAKQEIHVNWEVI